MKLLFHKRFERIMRKGLPFLLVLSLALLPLFGIMIRAADGDPVYTTKTLYEWKRVRTQEDLKDYDDYVLICWADGNGSIVYSSGSSITNSRVNGLYEADNKYINVTEGNGYSDTFVTASVDNLWKLTITGQDGDNEKTYEGKITVANGERLYDNDNWLSKFTENGTTFLFATSADSSCAYGDHIAWGPGDIGIVHNRSGYDRYVKASGAQLSISEYDAGDVLGDDEYDCYGFIIYKINARLNYSALDSFTVASGQVVQLKDSAFLKDKAIITIEKGGVLSVEGSFYNNGRILNYGTFIIGENSTVSSFDSARSDAGSIRCFGSKKGGEGNLIVLNGGKLIMPESESYLTLTSGASLNNYGLIMVPGRMIVDGSFIRNADSGYIFTQYEPTKSLGKLKDMKVDSKGKFPDYGIKLNYLKSNNFFDSVTLFRTDSKHFVEGSLITNHNSIHFEKE